MWNSASSIFKLVFETARSHNKQEAFYVTPCERDPHTYTQNKTSGPVQTLKHRTNVKTLLYHVLNFFLWSMGQPSRAISHQQRRRSPSGDLDNFLGSQFALHFNLSFAYCSLLANRISFLFQCWLDFVLYAFGFNWGIYICHELQYKCKWNDIISLLHLITYCIIKNCMCIV